MDKAVVNLGKPESTAGLTFVCLSRAKLLVDLAIEPLPLERLPKSAILLHSSFGCA